MPVCLKISFQIFPGEACLVPGECFCLKFHLLTTIQRPAESSEETSVVKDKGPTNNPVVQAKPRVGGRGRLAFPEARLGSLDVFSKLGSVVRTLLYLLFIFVRAGSSLLCRLLCSCGAFSCRGAGSRTRRLRPCGSPAPAPAW